LPALGDELHELTVKVVDDGLEHLAFLGGQGPERTAHVLVLARLHGDGGQASLSIRPWALTVSMIVPMEPVIVVGWATMLSARGPRSTRRTRHVHERGDDRHARLLAEEHQLR